MQELNMKDSLDANLVQMSTNYCLVYVTFSTAFFYRLSTHFLPMYIPFSVVEKNKQWTFKNICNSFLHSSISSVWIAFCLWNYPAHRYDLINVYSNQSYLLICFSVGYFLYDFLDMYWNDRDNSFHLLVHHLVVIGVFGVALYSRFYLGYAMVGLLVEVNSVFLHVRTLMRLSGWAHALPRVYWGVCVLNFGTFIVFRLYLLAYLTHWLLAHRVFLNPNLFLFTLPCLVTINAMSWLLFAKIAVEDFASSLLQAGRLLGWARLVRHMEGQIAAAERRGGDGGPSKGEAGHFLEKDPYLTDGGHIYLKEELPGRELNEDSSLMKGDKDARIAGTRWSDPARRAASSPAEEKEATLMGEQGKRLDEKQDCSRSERESKRESERCVGEKVDLKERVTKETKEKMYATEDTYSTEELEKSAKERVSAEETTSHLKENMDERETKHCDKEFKKDLRIVMKCAESDVKGDIDGVRKGNRTSDILRFAEDLPERTEETSLSHRLSLSESLARTSGLNSCSEFVETEDDRRVRQGKVKAS